MAITSKGGIFSLDLLFSFLTACFIIVFFLTVFSQAFSLELEEARRLSLSRKALSYADRLAKVSWQSFSPGLALSDHEKKRTRPNQVLQLNLRPDDPSIKRVYLKAVNFPFEQSLFLDANHSGHCLVAERIVLWDVNGWPEKAVLGVKACE